MEALRLKSKVFTAGLLLAALCAGGCGDRADPDGPAAGTNILIVVADALPASHLGCYGQERPTSPCIDRLAAESALFEDFYTVVPSTLPSFISLFTSRHPKDHGAPRNGCVPRDGLESLAQSMQEAGYETAFFLSSYCLTAQFGTQIGFDHFDEKLDKKSALPSNKLTRSARSVTDAVIGWLGGRDGERPYLAIVHYFDPHWPYEPPEEFARLFVDAETGSLEASFAAIRAARDALAKRDGAPGDKERRFRDLHLAEIRYMDSEIGRLLEEIGRNGGDDDTVVVFTADHGETFWEHEDYFNHGLSVYNSNLHIPLLIRAPGVVEPGRYAKPRFSNIDLAPTLLGLAGVAIPVDFEGIDRHRLFTGGGSVDPVPIFAEATKPHSAERGAARPNMRKAKCVMAGPWKLIWTPWEEGRTELFNVADDPAEKRNLAGESEYAPLVDELGTILRDWARSSAESGPVAIPGAVQRELDKLGYGK